MTSYTNTAHRHHSHAAPLTMRLGELTAFCKAAVRRWVRIQRSRARLSDLDDWLLADLGIRRDQIEDVVRAGKLPEWM